MWFVIYFTVDNCNCNFWFIPNISEHTPYPGEGFYNNYKYNNFMFYIMAERLAENIQNFK